MTDQISTSNLAVPGAASNTVTIPWSGAPILDICAVDADFGDLLLLLDGGVLVGFNLQTGISKVQCTVALPPIEQEDSHFGKPGHKLHASANGKFAAVVNDHCRQGVVVDVASGTVTMHLNGGDYYNETVPFSACFLPFDGRDIFVHRTDWNRLDAADPSTGTSLTQRVFADRVDNKNPDHYLDYFHGRLLPSANGQRIYDDGWAWHPVSVPRAWSVLDWLNVNPYESEDGASMVELTMRDDWNTPACWVGERHIALWNLATWDRELSEETNQGSGVLLLDVMQKTQAADHRWAMEIHTQKCLNLFSDEKYLCVVTDQATTLWELATRRLVATLNDFYPRLLHRKRGVLIDFGAQELVVATLPSSTAG